MKNKIFITGMGRSGTTLIEKLLTNHPKIDMLSQPFPLVFISLKSMFLESIGINEYYVLNNNTNDTKYTQEEFDKFLSNVNIKQEFLINLFAKMQQYSGQYTKPNSLIRTETDKGFYNFNEIFEASLNYFSLKNKEFTGTKETMCEEFLPYLCNNQFKSIIIVRDPRDVVASANYPKGEKHFGSKKPILFILRTWIKSINYIRLLQKNKNLFYFKYEDLVTAPYEILAKVTDFLGTTPFEKNHFEKGIYDRDGELWKANTSFDTKTSFISSKSVGGYRNVLSDDEINYIESICKSEMELMGYSFDTQPNKKIIKTFKDFGVEASEHLDKEFSSLSENIEQEIKRYDATAN